MSDVVGYVVLAKRPDNWVRRDIQSAAGFVYGTAGGIHPDIEPVLNHRGWCEDNAAEDPERYGGVEYVVGEIREVTA